MKYYTIALLTLIIYAFTSCSPIPDQESPQLLMDNPYAPQAGDSQMEIRNAYLDDIVWNAKTREVALTGNLPTPCNELRVFAAAEGGILVITAYSVYPPDEGCAQMLEPFQATLQIPDGFSHCIVNGEMIEL